MSLEKVLKYWLACSSGLLCRVLRGPIITPLLSKPLINGDIHVESVAVNSKMRTEHIRHEELRQTLIQWKINCVPGHRCSFTVDDLFLSFLKP